MPKSFTVSYFRGRVASLREGQEAALSVQASHAVYFRIDYFLMFRADRHRVLYCNIGVGDFSDHSGIYIKITLDVQHKNTIWRINTFLLNNI